MAQYLMALLGHRNPSLFGMDGESMERGQYGDYVFSQEGSAFEDICALMHAHTL